MTLYYADDAVTIYHGDAREFVADAVQGGAGEAVLVTDPPYGIGYSTSHPGLAHWCHGQQAIEGDADTSARDYVLSMWPGPALVFGSVKVTAPAAARAVLIWDKGPALGSGALDIPWKPSWEEIYVIGKGWTGTRDEGAVIYCPPVQSIARNGRVHPHQKPTKLMRRLLAKCPPGLLFDPFMGSGTTLRAAKDLGRRAVGVEIEERYCEIAAKRCAQDVLDVEAA